MRIHWKVLENLLKVTVKKNCFSLSFLTMASSKQIFFFPFLTCSSSPSNFTPIAYNVIVSAFYFLFIFFSPLMYNHTTSSQLYYKYLQNLQRLHARYVQSAKTTELNLRNTARKSWQERYASIISQTQCVCLLTREWQQ